MPTLQDILSALPKKKPAMQLLLEASDDEKEIKELIPLAPSLKGLMRSMFKADHPYRTRLGLTQLLVTSAAGILNFIQSINSIASTYEWASIDALFDEFFIHSMTIRVFPFNHGGGGLTAVTGTVGGTPTFAASPGTATSCGVLFISLFNTSGAYSSSSGMLSNPSVKHFMSNQPIKYVWRNNVKFDPRGLGLGPLTSIGWQGWTEITSSTYLGGNVQARTINDYVLGDTAHPFTVGAVSIVFDVSFRARA